MSKKNKTSSSVQRGIERAAHFASGGSLAEWRGLHTVQPCRKKEESKTKCRGLQMPTEVVTGKPLSEAKEPHE